MSGNVRSYLKKRAGTIILFLLFAGIFYVVFYLYNIPAVTVSYAFLLFTAVAFLALVIDFVRYAGRVKMLERMKSAAAFEMEEFPKPVDKVEVLYQEMAAELFVRKSEMESDNTIARKDMLDYYSLWAHQIKTPISAMRLLLQSEDVDEVNLKKAMKMELFKTEQYVEMVLSYLRMENMSSDLVLQWYPIDKIIKQAIRKYSQMFILQKISLDYEPAEQMVLTDEKWLSFVFEQVISNALKYTKTGGRIRIYMDPERKETLIIEDNGIGIQEDDLPRVFEKGFTGYNGRDHRKSTGIGLYLCHQIIERLNHGISISSAPGEGTKVAISLYRKERRIE